MTIAKLIIVWGNEDILCAAIESILAAQTNWKVVGTSSKADFEALIQSLETVQSDIVIIHSAHQSDPTNLPLQLLQDYPTLKVISVTLENNALEVYSKQKIIVNQATDLIQAIENEPASPEVVLDMKPITANYCG